MISTDEPGEFRPSLTYSLFLPSSLPLFHYLKFSVFLTHFSLLSICFLLFYSNMYASSHSLVFFPRLLLYLQYFPFMFCLVLLPPSSSNFTSSLSAISHVSYRKSLRPITFLLPRPPFQATPPSPRFVLSSLPPPPYRQLTSCSHLHKPSLPSASPHALLRPPSFIP